MSPFVRVLITFVIFVLIIYLLDRKYDMLKDINTMGRKTYSLSRVQMAWWTIIVLACMVAIMTLGKGIPTLDSSTLILLGISSGTIAAARIIDTSENSKSEKSTGQTDGKFNLILDLLSDAQGVSIPRFQALAFNVVFGLYIVISVVHNMNNPNLDISQIIPVIGDNNLILLGLSSGVYTTLKVAENKSQPNTVEEFKTSTEIKTRTEIK